MIKQCTNCKYWEICENADLPINWGCCSLGGSYGGEPDNKASLAVAQDGEQHDATLTTHATFSCNQWER